MACGTPPPPSSERPAASAVRVEANPGVRVYRGLDAPPAVAPAARNPFRFGVAGAPSSDGRREATPLPPPDGLPTLPLPLARPPLRLLGLVTLTDGSKVAVISVGSDLTLAHAGDLVANRFRLGAIAEDAVEITDVLGESSFSLKLP